MKTRTDKANLKSAAVTAFLAEAADASCMGDGGDRAQPWELLVPRGVTFRATQDSDRREAAAGSHGHGHGPQRSPRADAWSPALSPGKARLGLSRATRCMNWPKHTHEIPEINLKTGRRWLSDTVSGVEGHCAHSALVPQRPAPLCAGLRPEDKGVSH